MCICFYTLRHPKYSLVLITNRDEFLSRPTLPAGWRGPRNATLCGLDVKGGGTWFGIEQETGKFALLTNVREEVTTRTRSRGKLVTDWLDSPANVSLEQHMTHLRSTMDHYAGFNLLAGKSSPDGMIELAFVSNRSRHTQHETKDAHSGVPDCIFNLENGDQPGVMSNGAIACNLDSQSSANLEKAWPKMAVGRKAFREANEKFATIDSEVEQKQFEESLFEVLGIAYPDIRDKEEVRSSVLVTPFDILPPQRAWYATRAQTILLIERGTGIINFIERQGYEVDEAGEPRWSGSTKYWQFQVQSFGG